MKNKILFLGLISSLLLVGAGCGKVQVVSNDGGVYKSFDNGTKWEQKTAVLSVGQPKSISNFNVAKLTFDPVDSNSLYLVSTDGRLFVTFDAAESWQEITKAPKGAINSLALNPQTGESVYLAVGNKIYKSDCSCHNWQNIYLEALPNIQVTSLAIDGGDTNKILAGLSDGRIIKSGDGGNNWSTFYDFKNKIAQIMFNPNNTAIIFVNTIGGGLWRSDDAGNTWQNLDQNLKNFRGGRDVALMIFDPTRPNSLVTSSVYGLLRSDDGGQDWTDYKLLSQPGKAVISAFGFNLKNPSEIYYTTNNTLYRSYDGGSKWQTKSLLSKRTPTALLIDPSNPHVLYLGLARIEK
jgi:photosystem II stability/assembly factor-like uncharacterized protein